MRRILVTAISGNIGYGILKALKSEEYRLFGCDVNEIAAGMDLVSEFWQCRYAAEKGYIEELLEKCRKYQITHLIPVNEREIEAVGRERQKFEQMNVKIVIQTQKVLDICLDKYRTARFLWEHGLDVPQTYTNKSEIRENGYNGTEDSKRNPQKRYILKPIKSNGSKNITLYNSYSEIPEDIGVNCILQEYIESTEEYTVGVFRQNETINVISFLRQLKDGYSSQVELTEDEQIVRIAEKAAAAFDLEGYFNLQLRKKDGRYYIFEINPRISGTVRFRHMLGFTDVLWWLDLLDGITVGSWKNAYKKAVGIRELNEKFLILE